MYFVYILYQPNRDKFYIGTTAQLKRRLKEHFYSKVISTRSNYEKPKLIYYEYFLSKEDAKNEKDI